MANKSDVLRGLIPYARWQDEILMRMRNAPGRFLARRRGQHIKPFEMSQSKKLMLKKSRNRLARFLPRHGRLMVR